MLAARQISLRRGDRRLLDAVSLTVLPGEIHAILGPNGAGKSTLLRALAGDLKPDSGDVSLDERVLPRWPLAELARRRAVLPQHETLRFAFTAAEVVALGRLPWNDAGSAEHERIVEASLQAAGVAALAERRYPTLSGGERARVQFARVLAQLAARSIQATAAPFLLLDEPTASLDLAHQHHCLQQMRRFADAGGGVLAVLHDPNQALAYADRVTLLDAGRLLITGSPAEVLTAPRLSALYGIELVLHHSADGHALIAPAKTRGARATA